MEDAPSKAYEPPQPTVVQAVMVSHGELHLWQVGAGLWQWYSGCANVAAAGFFQTVCEQLTDFPAGGYRLDVRGNGSARSLIAEAWRGVNSSRPYPRSPSYVLGASMWALARNGISFGFVQTVGKVKLMAKAGKKGDAGPEALPSTAQSGSLSLMFHDVLLLDCSYQVQGSAVRVRIEKSHVTGSLEALLTVLAGVAGPILRGDASGGKTTDGDLGELMQLELDGVIDQLAPKPTGAPVLSHDGKAATVPAVAGKIEQVTPAQAQAAAEVDAIASTMNQSADGGASTEVDELPFDVMAGLEPLQDLEGDKPGDQMIEVEDITDDLQPLETLGDDQTSMTEVLLDADSTELATGSGSTVVGQADLTDHPTAGVVGDDVEIEVEEISDLEETEPLQSLAGESGNSDEPGQLEEGESDDGSDAPPPVVGQVGDDELDELPEPVGSPKADEKTKAAVAKASGKSTKAATTQQAASQAAKKTESTVPEGKVAPAESEAPGIRIPSPSELKKYAEQLSEAGQAGVVKVRDGLQAKFTTLESIDGQARKLVGDGKWDEVKGKFAGKPIGLVHRWLLGAYIVKAVLKEQKATTAT